MDKTQALESRLTECFSGTAILESDIPLIGISGNFKEGDCTLAQGYWMSVVESGAMPLIIPPVDTIEGIISLLDRLDGIILSGGSDIDPVLLGEEPLDSVQINPQRDIPELLLARLAYERHIPILGICRGIQILTAAFGGRLYQDIATQYEKPYIAHNQKSARTETSHSVTIARDSLLCSILGSETVMVNSFHHQAVKEAPSGFRISALSPDGIIEGIEATDFNPVIGVQWHPECFILAGNRFMMPLFDWLKNEALIYRKAKKLHDSAIVLDSHCDTPIFFDKGARFDIMNPGIQVEYDYVCEKSPDGSPTFSYNPLVDLHKMTIGRQDVSFMVAYLRQEGRDTGSLQAATAKAGRLLKLIDDRIAACEPYARIANTPDEVIANRHQGIKSIVKGIENGYAIGLDTDNVARFREMGVAYMTLCHNSDNEICDSAKGNNEHNGLSDFGREVVRRMNSAGMMVDLSHASEKSFYDALECSVKPIICSHSSSRVLCNHPRNLTDDQLRSLAAAGGVAQVCMYDGFLKKGGGATVVDAVRHLMHMIDIMGIEHVGIGTDFDGGGGVPGLSDATWLVSFTGRLISEGLTPYELTRIWGANFLSVWQRISAPD